MIQIRRTFKLMAFHIIERRLEEERVQSELKKRERDEQHLFLTAKVCNVTSAFLDISESRFRLSRMKLSRAMKDLTLPPLMKRIGRHQSFPVSVF